MNIIPYTQADEVRCMEIFDSNCPKYFAEHERDEFLQTLRDPGIDPYFIIELSGELVGCGGIFLNHEKKICGLSWGMVHRDFHKQGFGEKLVRHRLALLDEQFTDYKQLVNTAQYTEAFYERFGFTTVRVIKDGWGPSLDKYEMEKVI